MGVKDELEKIEKFKEKYAFLKDEKNRKIISGLTNGLVTPKALDHMSTHITNLADGIKLIDLEKDDTKQFDAIWNKLQNGFIDYAYNMYEPKPGEKRLSKNAYFNLVIDAIEMCPHEKVVATKEWLKIYNIALTEKEAYNNQKNLEFLEETAKIDDMYGRYYDALRDYDNLEKSEKRKKVIEAYGDNIEKLDNEIAEIENSKEYKAAKEEIENYKKIRDAAENAYKEAKAVSDAANDEYKKLLDNTVQSVYEKYKENLKERFKTPRDLRINYTTSYQEQVNAVKKIRELKAEIDRMQPEFSATMDKISDINEKMKLKDLEVKSIKKEIQQIGRENADAKQKEGQIYQIEKEKKGLSATKKGLEEVVKNFDQKLQEYRTLMFKWSLIPEGSEINYRNYKTISDTMRDRTLKIDMESVEKKLAPWREIENAVKSVKEQVDALNKKKDKLYSNFANMKSPITFKALLDDYARKLGMRKKVRDFEDAKRKLIEVETELHSNDYKMIQAPDLLGDIKNTAEAYWARRDMRKGLHINTKEFDAMINSVKNLKDLDFKGKTSIYELSPEERKKLGDALTEARDKAKAYLKVKLQQNRKHPSALRQTRLGYAMALADGLDAKIKKLDEVSKKYAEVAKVVSGKIQQLEHWKKNPVLVDPAKLKTNVKEVPTKKDPEITGPNVSSM